MVLTLQAGGPPKVNLVEPVSYATIKPVPLGAPSSPLIGEGRLTVTPALAEEILQRMNYSRQRRLKDFRLHRHMEVIKRNQWDSDCTIRFALLNGVMTLVDGQHRLTAIVRTGTARQVIIVVTPVQTEAELHLLYSRIDVDGNRTMADAMGAAEPFKDATVGKELQKACAKAMWDLANDFPHRRLLLGENELITKEDRINCMAFWINEAARLDAIVMGGQRALRDRLRVPGVVAVALATLKHQPERAEMFWARVAANQMLRPGDPEQALITFLLAADLRATPYTAKLAAVQAWNAWYRGSPLKTVRKDAGYGKPIHIAGTTYQGRD